MFVFCESSGLSKKHGDKKPKGMRRMVIGRLRRRVPKSPAMDAAQTRHEDNFGIPLDALDETPPVGIPSSDSDSEAASQPRQRPHFPKATVGTARSAPCGSKGARIARTGPTVATAAHKKRVCGERAKAERRHGRCSLAVCLTARGECRHGGVAGNSPLEWGAKDAAAFAWGKPFPDEKSLVQKNLTDYLPTRIEAKNARPPDELHKLDGRIPRRSAP